MTTEPLRVVLITGIAPIAEALAASLRELGHEPVAILTSRRAATLDDDLVLTDASAPKGLDLLFARDKRSMEPLLRAVEPDLVVCFGFPWLIPSAALAVPRLGAINLHPALLPRHRGPIPMAWSIRAGDPTYGVTWHRMDDAFDTGPILAQAPVPMEPDDAEIRIVGPRLLGVAMELLPQAIERVLAGDPGDPQAATGDEPYAAWFDDDYMEIDWSRPAVEIDRQVRAWAFASPGGPPAGPRTTIDGRRVVIRRTSLTDPASADGAVRMEAADGPVWIVVSEPLEHEEPEATPQP